MKNSKVRALVVLAAAVVVALVLVGSAIGTGEISVTRRAVTAADNSLTISVESTGDAGNIHGNANPWTSPVDPVSDFFWFNQPVRITDFALEDVGNGTPVFSAATWAIDFGSGYSQPTALTSPFILGYDGVYSIVATGTDSVLGDVTGTITPAFGVDQIPPVVDSTAVLPYYKGTPELTVSATDTLSGVENALFNADGEQSVSWQPTTSNPSVFSIDWPFTGQGLHTLGWSVFDNAGNMTSNSEQFYIDNEAPTTDSDALTLYNGPATIHLDATDNPTPPGASGVAATYYRVKSNNVFGAVTPGTTVNVTAPASSYATHTLEFWSVDEVGNVEATRSVDFRINSQHTITVEQPAYSSGTISPSAPALINLGASSATYLITPATGYHQVSSYVDGVSVGAIGSYTFTNVTASHVLSTWMTINTYTITPQKSNNNGTISPSGGQVVNYGGSKKFTMTPKSHYKISKVLVNGVNVGHPSSYTVSNVKQNTTIKVYFVHK